MTVEHWFILVEAKIRIENLTIYMLADKWSINEAHRSYHSKLRITIVTRCYAYLKQRTKNPAFTIKRVLLNVKKVYYFCPQDRHGNPKAI